MPSPRIAGSSATFVAAALTRLTDRPCVLLVAHLDEADEICDELTSFGVDAARLPAPEVLPGETNINGELLGELLPLAPRPVDGVGAPLIIAPVRPRRFTNEQNRRRRITDAKHGLSSGSS